MDVGAIGPHMTQASAPTPGETWTRKGEADRRFAISVAEVTADEVQWHERGGGELHTSRLAEFLSRFEPVSAEVQAEWSETFQAARFVGAWFDQGAKPLPGYTNGDNAMGWEQPHFSREVILDAIASNLIGNRGQGHACIFDEDTDSFVLVSTVSGDPVPDDLNFEAILELADDDEESDEYVVEIEYGKDIVVEGQTVHVYELAALIWELAED